VYKATVRWLIRRNIERLNEGCYEPALEMFGREAQLVFPGDNTWSNMFRPTVRGRDAFATHRGRVEIEAFLQRYVGEQMHMVVDDILVNGPPWNTRAAVRVHHWIPGPGELDVYTNRAVLFVNTSWGRIRVQEDYEDTERVAAYDQLVAGQHAKPPAP
jgi:hypothetical protein